MSPEIYIPSFFFSGLLEADSLVSLRNIPSYFPLCLTSREPTSSNGSFIQKKTKSSNESSETRAIKNIIPKLWDILLYEKC